MSLNPVRASHSLAEPRTVTLSLWSSLGTLAIRGVVLTFVLLIGTMPAMAVSYTYTIIDYPGANGTLLEGINNNGQIVGSFFPTANTGFVGFLPLGFRYDGGNFSPLIPPDASSRVLAFGINDLGQASGYYNAVNPDAPIIGSFQGFIYTNGNYSPVIIPTSQLDRGRETPLLAGINNSGQTVGNGLNGAFVYSNGMFTPIQVPGPPNCPSCWFTVAGGINSKCAVS